MSLQWLMVNCLQVSESLKIIRKRKRFFGRVEGKQASGPLNGKPTVAHKHLQYNIHALPDFMVGNFGMGNKWERLLAKLVSNLFRVLLYYILLLLVM